VSAAIRATTRRPCVASLAVPGRPVALWAVDVVGWAGRPASARGDVVWEWGWAEAAGGRGAPPLGSDASFRRDESVTEYKLPAGYQAHRRLCAPVPQLLGLFIVLIVADALLASRTR